MVKVIIYLIFLLLQCNYHIATALDTDESCFATILNDLFGFTDSFSLCSDTGTSTNEFEFSNMCVGGYLDTIYIYSKITPLQEISYNHLKCFYRTLNQLTLENIIIDSQNTFGISTDRAISTNICLYDCTFLNTDNPISTSGNSISSYTSIITIKVGENFNLNKIRLSWFKTQTEINIQYYENIPSVYPEIINDAQGSIFQELSISTKKIPSFLDTIFISLIIELIEPTSDETKDSLVNLGTLNNVRSLSLVIKGTLDYPIYLSSNVNVFDSLYINGLLTVGDSNGYNFPPNLKSLQFNTPSPNFNINGRAPFKEYGILENFNIKNMGLTEFPILPPSIITMSLYDNSFSTTLPDLSNYKNLYTLVLINCHFTGPIPFEYGRIPNLDLRNNSLSGKIPQSIACYPESFTNIFDGNPLLLNDICDTSTIVPNLEYNDLNKFIKIYGSNLGPPNGGGFLRDINQFLNYDNIGLYYYYYWNEIIDGTIPQILTVSFQSREYSLPIVPLIPQFTSYSKVLREFTFKGSNYSYNKTDIEVSISSIKGIITYIDFNTIVADFPNSISTIGEAVAIIKNTKSNLYVEFSVNTIDIILCSSDCGYNEGKGFCDTLIGICNCSQKWIDPSCSTPNQFLTSASSTTTQGGLVNLYGWFGDVHKDLQIKIGSFNCSIHTINSTFSNCTIGGGSGTKSITIIQNGIIRFIENIFHYTEIEYKCPKNCSSNGICNKSTGQCNCYIGYGGYDCNSKTSTVSSSTSSTTIGSYETPAPTLSPIEIPKSNTTVNETSGSTIINNQQTSYEISILSLVELDILDNIVLVHNLTNKWISEENSNSNIYRFVQTIQETCNITYSIENIKESRDYTFAGLKLSLDKDSIKISIKIENYPFTNSLNKLQLRIESSAGEKNNSNQNLNNECNNKETQIDTGGLDKDQLLNYITISKNEKILYGRFINRVLSDTRESFITTTLVSNTTSTIENKQSFIIGLNLPFFTNSLVIDPDFSVLTSLSFKKCNSNNNQKESWVLPVSIVIPCVAVATIIVFGAIIYRNNKSAVLVLKNKIKLKSLSKRRKQELYMPNYPTRT